MPTQVHPPELTTEDIETIARRVFNEMKSNFETSQALMIQEIRNINVNLSRIEESLNSNFLRKETFDGLEKQVNQIDANITWLWRAIGGSVVTGILAILLKR